MPDLTADELREWAEECEVLAQLTARVLKWNQLKDRAASRPSSPKSSATNA